VTADDAVKSDTKGLRKKPDTMRSGGTTEKDMVGRSDDQKRLAFTHPLEDSRKLEATIRVQIYRLNLKVTRF
jgi:hypothetical protein